MSDDRHEDVRPDGGVVADVGVNPAWLPDITLGRTGTIAKTEYRLAIRSHWALGLTAVFALFALGLTTFSGAEVAPAGYERTVASLASLAVYLLPLAALAFGYDAIVGREDSGWLQALFALPIGRFRVVMGIFLGRAVVLAGSIVIGFGVAGVLLLREFGVGGWPTYVRFTLAAVLAGWAFLALATLVSSVAREKTHAFGVVLAAWAWFVLVYDLLALGIIAAFRLSDAVISVLIIGNPAGLFRLLVLGGLETGGSGGYGAAFAAAGVPTWLLVFMLLSWTVVPLVLAGILARRRSL